MRHLALLLVLPAVLLAGEAGAAKAPSAEEVFLLDRLNQHREEPRRCDGWVSNAIRTEQVKVSRSALHSWAKRATSSGTFPPVAFNPLLNEAARALLQAGTKPVTATRFDATPAMRAAGYAPGKENLALFADDCPSLAIAYAAGMTNCVGLSGEKKEKDADPILTGFYAIKGDWREAGVAVAAAGGKFSMVMLLAPGSAKRHLGGIAFADANRDGRYDLGEGKAGVKVSCGAATMTTAAGGVWWLALDSLDPATVTFTTDNLTAVRPVAKDVACAAVSWRFPNPNDQKTADRLIAEAEKAVKNPDPEQHKTPLAALLVGTRLAALDDDRQKKVDALLEPIKDTFAATMKRVLAALGEEPEDYKKTVATIKKSWNGAMPGWFKEAEGLAALRTQVNAALGAAEDQQAKLAQPLLKPLAKAMADTCDPVFLDQYKTWSDALTGVLPIEGAPPKKKKK